MTKIKSSEITPEHLYVSRRKFMTGVGALAASAAVLAACGPSAEESSNAGDAAPAANGSEAHLPPQALPQSDPRHRTGTVVTERTTVLASTGQ